MKDKIIIIIVVVATLGILGVAVLQQQKRLPELEAKRPPTRDFVTPPPGIGEGQGGPLEFASLFQNLKPAKQECFREKFGEERLGQILENPVFIPSPEDNSIIGGCLLAGATFEGDFTENDSGENDSGEGPLEIEE